MPEQTFLLPDLGEGLTEAEVVRWLVAEGDIVAADQNVVEVETAKSIVEVPTPFAGRVATLHAAEGATIEVGKPLLTVAAVDDEPAPSDQPTSGSGSVLVGYGTSEVSARTRHRRPRRSVPLRGSEPERRSPSAPRVISPLVRRLAHDAGLDLRTIEPSEPGGVIRRADVERALAARPGAAPVSGERRIPLSGFRKAVAAALSRSRTEIPEATVWVDVDATELWELRQRTRTDAEPGPGLLAYVARFVVAALRQYPVLNARFDAERQEIVEFDHVNLGIAVDTDRGLLAPAIMRADTMTTAQLDAEIRRVTARAREARATAEELAAGTITLNNYGSFGVDGSAAIINHPQVAILGIGRIIDRPWVVDGELCARKVTQLSLVFDHRVCDGATAAGFLRSVADAIEDPASMIARL